MNRDADIARLARDVARLDELVVALYRHFDVPFPEPAPAPSAPPGVLEAIDEGRALVAIKLYRDATGVGLAEAKQAVEDLASGR